MGDLILSEGSELHGIVLYIVRPVCRQFDHDNLLQIFEFDGVCPFTLQQGN